MSSYTLSKSNIYHQLLWRVYYLSRTQATNHLFLHSVRTCEDSESVLQLGFNMGSTTGAGSDLPFGRMVTWFLSFSSGIWWGNHALGLMAWIMSRMSMLFQELNALMLIFLFYEVTTMRDTMRTSSKNCMIVTFALVNMQVNSYLCLIIYTHYYSSKESLTWSYTKLQLILNFSLYHYHHNSQQSYLLLLRLGTVCLFITVYKQFFKLHCGESLTVWLIVIIGALLFGRVSIHKFYFVLN